MDFHPCMIDNMFDYLESIGLLSLQILQILVYFMTPY